MHKSFFLKLTLIAVIFSIFAPMATATDKVNLRQAQDIINKMRKNVRSSHQSTLQQALGLTPKTTFKLVKKFSDKLNLNHYRYQMQYNGIPVWGQSIIVSEDSNNRVYMLYGNAMVGMERDVVDTVAKIDAETALQIAKKHHAQTKKQNWLYQHQQANLIVYVDGNRARLCYQASFFADVKDGGQPTSPIYLIDAKTKEVVHYFEGLMTEVGTGKGPGGNEKTGQYNYGQQYDAFEVKKDGDNSVMDVKDKVKVVDLDHSTSGSTAYSFAGDTNLRKKINGAYSPLNDAMAFGMAVFNMYQQWYNTTAISGQLVLKVHYSKNYENAFYSSWGGYMAFGDGASRFYPLVSLDVVSHEVGHGFTRSNSNLTYSAQSGGINESFSDMAGEAAEYYMTGTNDFEVGATIFKQQGKALRYMYNPPLDGKSIGHVDEYTNGMDVHYSGGVYNKVFYLLATSPGWNTKMAFDVFVRCNQAKWTAGETFQSAGVGTYDAAAELGYNTEHVKKALAGVGVIVNK